MTTRRIEHQVERSSLGTPAARAARRTVSADIANRVVARAETVGRTAEKAQKRLGGNRPGRTYR